MSRRRLVRPHTHGALVAIWSEGELLLVETSCRATCAVISTRMTGNAGTRFSDEEDAPATHQR